LTSKQLRLEIFLSHFSLKTVFKAKVWFAIFKHFIWVNGEKGSYGSNWGSHNMLKLNPQFSVMDRFQLVLILRG
jgi:hypothetical protein